MADLSSAIQMVNDLVTRIDKLNEEADRFDVGTLVLRLDVLRRMLVNLDIDQEILLEFFMQVVTPLRDHSPLIYRHLNTKFAPLPRMDDVEDPPLRSLRSREQL